MKTKRQDTLATFSKIILSIIIITAIECFALILVAMIPQKHIENNINESADILLEKNVFFYMNENDIASRIDRYADSILLNIAYSYDNKQPLESVMRSSYYYEDTQNENNNLKSAITDNLSPNKNYIRYWHGSNIIVKPLLLLTNINGIYRFIAITILVLLIATLLLLQKHINKQTAICMLLACFANSIWYVPFSLEYSWNIIIMFVATILALFIYQRNSVTIICFFILIGNITAYFDFLSTETLTFTIPVICILLLKNKNNLLISTMDHFKLTIKLGLSWLVGYTSAWIMKWTIASVVLQTNAFKSALQQANTRIVGETENISTMKQAFGAFTRNVSCLFPFSYLEEHAFGVIVIVIGVIGIFYYLFKRNNDIALPSILILIALIPYARFILISNHSYLHYFFTYRAQLASVFAFSLAIIYGLDYTMLKKEWGKLCKHRRKR